MPSKLYVVKEGRKTGIFNTWSECEKQVKGYSGAVYKSFKTRSEAEQYLGLNNDTDKDKSLNKEDIIEAYVDGSYEHSIRMYGSGAVILKQDQKIMLKSSGNEKSLVDMRNVAGEIKAAELAMDYAIKDGAKKLVIYHDYEGIAKWCTKEWKANKLGTKAYASYYDEVAKKIDVEFVKVKAHAGNFHNEEADELAKSAIKDLSAT